MVGKIFVGLSGVLVAIGVAMSGDERVNPSGVTFAGRPYEVRYAGDHVWLTAPGGVVTDLGRGQTLVYADFSGDGLADLCVYADDRDGFRNTFSYLTLYRDDGTSIDEVEPVEAKWKEGHWAWIDLAQWPGLDPSRVHGLWMTTFMRRQDAARSGWF